MFSDAQYYTPTLPNPSPQINNFPWKYIVVERKSWGSVLWEPLASSLPSPLFNSVISKKLLYFYVLVSSIKLIYLAFQLPCN